MNITINLQGSDQVIISGHFHLIKTKLLESHAVDMQMHNTEYMHCLFMIKCVIFCNDNLIDDNKARHLYTYAIQ